MKVRIKHHRWYQSPIRYVGDTLRSEHVKNSGETMLAKGGKTVVELLDEETGAVLGVGIAVCSRKDPYSKKRGAVIAASRAIEASMDWVIAGKVSVIGPTFKPGSKAAVCNYGA